MKYLFLALFLLFSACGYKPVAQITKESVGESVFVDVIVSKRDPQNSVAIKDGIREALIKRLGKDLVSKNEADTIIIASIQSVNFSVSSYDQYGYANAYETNVVLNYQVRFKDGSMKTILATGTSDFRINRQIINTLYTDSVISNKDRFEAIKQASSESFSEFLAKLAILSEIKKQGKDWNSKQKEGKDGKFN